MIKTYIQGFDDALGGGIPEGHVVLVSEMMPGTEVFGPFREDFLADGTLFLKQYEVGETDIQLRIRCVKMRHASHARGYYALIHRHGGFMVTRVISD